MKVEKDGRIVYEREEFISYSQRMGCWKEETIKYCDENPKETYNDDDYKVIYYMHKNAAPGGDKYTMHLWNEESSDMDRIVSEYCKFMYGED